MNSYTAIIVSIGIFIIAGIVFIFWPKGSEQIPPENWTPGTSNTTSVSPGQNATSTGVPAEWKPIRAAFEEEIALEGNPDNTKLGRTAVVDEWALQNWVGDNMGGEALLRFSATSSRWILVSAGGGAWGLEGLMYYGVPQDVAVSLLFNLRQKP